VPVIEKYSPFRDLDLMERWVRRMFSDFSPSFVPSMTPAADVYETDAEFVVELEVPGYEEKELNVEITDHTLTVKGTREEAKKRDEKALRLHERLESFFERRFELPRETDSKRIKAEYGKGVLTLHVPKTAESKPRKIASGKK
jgi:HSP20 family protein